MPPLRWIAPMTASTVSERIEALSRPPVVSSPRPSLMCWPRSISRATSASARALTTAARSLASRPSERSGWVVVERLGDHDPEHRVAEELEALVGRDAARSRRRTSGASGRAAAARDPGPDHRALRAARRCSAGLLAVRGPGDGRPWRRTGRTAARAVREVLGAAGGVGAGHEGGRDGLPLRTAVTRVAARHLPLRNSHGCLLYRCWPCGRPGRSCLWWCCGPAAARSSPAQRGSIGASCAWSGRRRAARRTRRTVRDSRPRHSGWNGSASTTASRSSGSRSSRSSSSRLVSSSRSRSSCSVALACCSA